MPSWVSLICGPCDYFRISSTAVSLPTSAKLANPINRPCSTTPGMSLSMRASAGGSSIFPKLQSRIGIAVVGEVRTAVGACAQFYRRAERGNLFFDHRSRERNNFDRQRKFPEHGNQLAGIGDHDHLLRGCGNDFFAQQRAASAFDQIELRIDFVRAVDIDVDHGMLVERGLAECRRRGPVRRWHWKWECRRSSGQPSRARPEPAR